MKTRPRSNLDRANSDWAKSIEADLDALLGSHDTTALNVKALGQQVSSTGNAVAATNNKLSEAVATIAPATVVPTQVQNVVVSDAPGYDTAGNVTSFVTITWDAVTTDINGNDLTPGAYEVTYKQSVGGDYRLLGTTINTSLTNIPVAASTSYDFRVRAQNSAYTWGDYSTIVTYVTGTPSIASSIPSVPILTSNLGALTVHWDGLLSGGVTPGKNFRGVLAQYSLAATGPWTNAGQSLYLKGESVISSLNTNTRYYVRLVGFDIAGSQSTPSGVTSIVVTAVDLGDLDASVTAAISAAQNTADSKNAVYYQAAAPTGGIYHDGDLWFETDNGYVMYVRVGSVWTASPLGAGAIASGAITAGKITANAIATNMLQAGAVTAAKIAAGTITSNEISAGSITANNLSAGSVTSSKLTSTAIDGFTITGATIQTDGSSNAGVKISSTGIEAFNTSGVRTVLISAATGNTTIAGLTATSAVVTGTINATGGTFSGSLAVTGTLTGGTYQTAASGQRVRVNGTSVTFYSPNGANGSIFASDNGASGMALSFNGTDFIIAHTNLPAGGSTEFQGTRGYISDLFTSRINDYTTGLSLGRCYFGSVAVASVPAGGNINTTISIPAGLFVGTPVIVGSTDSGRLTVAASSVTSTSAVISTSNWSPVASPIVTLNWVAIGV